MPKQRPKSLEENQEAPVQPESPENAYPEEQVYENFEDYDELYGPDAYLGDQYPMTPTGHILTEAPQPFASATGPEPGDEIRQQKKQEIEEIRSESVEAQEEDEARAGQALPRE